MPIPENITISLESVNAALQDQRNGALNEAANWKAAYTELAGQYQGLLAVAQSQQEQLAAQAQSQSTPPAAAETRVSVEVVPGPVPVEGVVNDPIPVKDDPRSDVRR